MDTQDPPSRPRYQLTRGLIGLDNEKRCYDITLSGQELQGSTTRHLASTHWDRYACEGIMHSYKATFSVVWRAGLHRPD